MTDAALRAGHGGRRILAAKCRFGWWLMAPALAMFAANSVFPTIFAIVASLQNYQLLIAAPARFNNFANYAHIVTDPLFWSSLRVTGWFVLGVVALQFPVGLLLALLLHRLPRWQGPTATLLLIPTIIAPSVGAFQWVQLFNFQFGPINYVLGLLGLPQPIWTGSPAAALPSLIVVDFWEWTPFMMLLLFAGLRALPASIVEAARVDGSSIIQVVWRIYLPLLRPVIGIALLLRVLMSFKLFDIVYVMTQGGPGAATENLAYFTYVQGFRYFNLGYASALAILQLALVALLAKALIRLTERGDPQGSAA